MNILNDILFEIQKFSFTKMHQKMYLQKWQPICKTHRDNAFNIDQLVLFLLMV